MRLKLLKLFTKDCRFFFSDTMYILLLLLLMMMMVMMMMMLVCVCVVQLLEYVGRGKSIIDVGLAQARHPLTTRYHYFELQIVDPGENCYVAIGLARRVL